MRVCRVCLSLEEAETFEDILKDGCKSAVELFDLFGILASKDERNQNKLIIIVLQF